MTPSTSRETASLLDEVIRRLPGVSVLYRSGPLARRIASAGLDALRRAEDAPFVIVEDGDGRTVVTVTIGVDADSAAETCRTVHDVVADWLRGRGSEDIAIAVTVAQVVG